MPDEMLTVTDVMARLKVGRSKVYDLIRSRRLASVKIDGCRRIPGPALTAYVSALLEDVA